MEKRIGSILIQVLTNESVHRLNNILTEYSGIITGRQGIPFKSRGFSIISLIVEGTTDEIGALSGKLGKLHQIRVRTIVLKNNNTKEL